MEKNKKKSRALIITFIVMLVLLFVFYFLIIKNNPFQAKGTSTENKSFLSLFSSSKKNKDLNVIDQNTDGGTDGEVISGDLDLENTQGNGGDNSNPGSELDPFDNRNGSGYSPKLLPIPTPDQYDPDNDPYKNPTNTDPYKPSPQPDSTEKKQCNFDDYKLKFTEAEQAELDKLLREFYRIASSIKTQEDIDLEYEAKKSYAGLVTEIKDLTNQCKVQTSDPKYLAGFDWKNSLSDDARDGVGTLISRNYSRSSEARTEKRPNPWFGSDDANGYFYTTSIVLRSESGTTGPTTTTTGTSINNPNPGGLRSVRFAVSGFENAKVPNENYYSGRFNNNFEAWSYCMSEAGKQRDIAKSSIPSDYSIDSRCILLDGIKPNYKITPGSSSTYLVRYPILKGTVWYPNANSSNTNGSDIDPKEWFYAEKECLRRAPSGCAQKYKDEPFFQTEEIAPIEWAYTITIRSRTFANQSQCESLMKLFKHNGTCTNDSVENAYILKNWENNVANGYVTPINYNIFERMFYIW